MRAVCLRECIPHAILTYIFIGSSLDLSAYVSLIVPREAPSAGWLAGMLSSSSTRLQYEGYTEADLQRPFLIAQCDYDKGDALHVRLIQTIYTVGTCILSYTHTRFYTYIFILCLITEASPPVDPHSSLLSKHHPSLSDTPHSPSHRAALGGDRLPRPRPLDRPEPVDEGTHPPAHPAYDRH